MGIKVGDKVRVEFKIIEDGLIEGRVEVVWDDGDFEVLSQVIYAGTNPEAYTINVLEKKQVEVGDVVKGKDLYDVVPVGSVVQSGSGGISFITNEGRFGVSGYLFSPDGAWTDLNFTVLFLAPKEV